MNTVVWEVTRVHQLNFSSIYYSVRSFLANNCFKQTTPKSSMLHILSLILWLLCQVKYLSFYLWSEYVHVDVTLSHCFSLLRHSLLGFAGWDLRPYCSNSSSSSSRRWKLRERSTQQRFGRWQDLLQSQAVNKWADLKLGKHLKRKCSYAQ